MSSAAQGFLLLRNVLTPAEVSELEAAVDRIYGDAGEPLPVLGFPDP